MAAWEVRPPRSVTMAAAFFMMGSQSGLVVSVTRTSPLLEAVHLLGIPQDPGPPLGNGLPHRQAFGQDLSPVQEAVDP
jgi:hypothetical protein